MRKVSVTATAIILVLCATSMSAYAANAHGPVSQAPHGHATVTHGPSTPSTHPTTTTTKRSTPTNGTSPATFSAGKTTTTRTTTGTRPTPPISPIAQKIASHPQLAQRITAMLPINPKTGKPITLNQAALGFRNQGQFIAAVQAAHRLNCSTCFMQIKTDMTKKGMSLGQAIQDVKKTTNTPVQARRADTDADDDVKTSTRTTSTSTTRNTMKGRVDAQNSENEDADEGNVKTSTRTGSTTPTTPTTTGSSTSTTGRSTTTTGSKSTTTTKRPPNAGDR